MFTFIYFGSANKGFKQKLSSIRTFDAILNCVNYIFRHILQSVSHVLTKEQSVDQFNYPEYIKLAFGKTNQRKIFVFVKLQAVIVNWANNLRKTLKCQANLKTVFKANKIKLFQSSIIQTIFIA